MSTWKMSKYFASKGHDVAVFSFAQSGHRQQDFAELFFSQNTSADIDSDSLGELRKTVLDFRPQIVINQMPYEHLVGTVLREDKSYLLLGCLRNSLFSVKNNIDQYGRQKLHRGLRPVFKNAAGRAVLLALHRARHRADLKRILRTYDRFIMFGPPNLEELRYFVPNFDPKKISLIPNSVPSILDQPPRKQNRILWLGRLTYEQKRADLILPIWRKVCDVLPDWHLDIVGAGPAYDDLRRMIDSERLERVTLHARQVPDEYFKSASIFLMTSAYEGFPNTLVEAQSFGAIPVLFDSFPVARWLVSSGKNGYLIPPFDLRAMADQIIETAQSDKIIGFMFNALENARRFHIDEVGLRWLSLFEECSKFIERS